MDLQPTTGFFTNIKSKITGKDYYTTSTGTKISMAAGEGKVEETDDGVIKIYDAKKVSVYGTSADDKLYVKNSHVKYINQGSGNNVTALDNCTYNQYNRFWGTGSVITTGCSFFKPNKGSDVIKIKGDFNGGILAQQGSGKAYGDDKKAHKDTIMINGDNNGFINIDTHDKVAISGKKGQIKNISVIYC